MRLISKVYLFVLLIICFGQVMLHAQSAKVKDMYAEGDEFFQAEDYKEAVYYFIKVLENGYNNANINYKVGFCYLQIPGEETKAIPYLEDAVKNISIKYKIRDLSERQAPLHSLFYMGNAYRIDNQLEKALEAYNKFVNSPGYSGNYNLNIVENELKACERAKIIQDSPVEVLWERLPDFINTPNTDVRPVISGDENVLVYLTSLKLYNAVYCSVKFDGQWQTPENINPQIISDGDYYPTALSFDGKELYLVKQGASNSDLYVSYSMGGKWTPAKPLNDNINTLKDEVSATISKDGKTLYFASDRRESRGGFDIYQSRKNANGEWGKATNLGKVINTKEDEISPSLSEDGNTLYFSSKGHYNMGGFDVFYSEKEIDTKWGIPVNIGSPVNTTNDNFDFKVIGNSKVGYIAKKMDKSSGSSDIYKIDVRSKFVAKKLNN